MPDSSPNSSLSLYTYPALAATRRTRSQSLCVEKERICDLKEAQEPGANGIYCTPQRGAA